MKSFLLPVLWALSLSGCALDEFMRKSEIEDGRSKCVEYGFRPGTTDFAQCVQRSVEASERESDRAFYEQERIRAEERRRK